MNDEADNKVNFHIYETTNGVPWKWCVAFPENSSKQDELRAWCVETYGETSEHMYYSTDDQNWHDVVHYGEIYLKSDKEMFLFNLKWLTPSL
jgi:hypothetical protein